MKIIGHRGAKGLAPENTLASFAKALDHNVDELECDVHVTKDNILVLTHDHVMHDAAGAAYVVRDHDLAYLRDRKPDLTTLKEAVDFINRRVPLMIEVKPNVPVEPVLDYIQAMRDQGWAIGDLTLASERYETLKAARERLPDLTLSIVDTWGGVRAGLRARRLGITHLSMYYRWLWSGFVIPMHRRGFKVSAYTVNNAQAAQRLRRMGVHAIFTDRPDLFDGQTKVH